MTVNQKNHVNTLFSIERALNKLEIFLDACQDVYMTFTDAQYQHMMKANKMYKKYKQEHQKQLEILWEQGIFL